MKRFIMAIVCLMTMVVLTSCGSTYEVTANYDVCYPDGTRSFTETAVMHNAQSVPYVVSYSVGGTNYISVVCSDNPMTNSKKAGHFITTTAPVRLNNYSVENTKKNNKNTAYNKSGGDDTYLGNY